MHGCHTHIDAFKRKSWLDGIHARVLKKQQCNYCMFSTDQLYCLIDHSTRHCYLKIEKEASVIPIKKSETSDPENYQSISLTSIVCEVLEHILSLSI